MMRFFVVSLVLLMACNPAQAWEARLGAVCELIHEGDNGLVRLTYDPAVPHYTIAVTPTRPWSGGPIFAMRFDGARSNIITTDRHTLTDDGATVGVADSGFGNVLNGLEFNDTATALLGDEAVGFSLSGAAPAVQAFRACASGVGV